MVWSHYHLSPILQYKSQAIISWHFSEFPRCMWTAWIWRVWKWRNLHCGFNRKICILCVSNSDELSAFHPWLCWFTEWTGIIETYMHEKTLKCHVLASFNIVGFLMFARCPKGYEGPYCQTKISDNSSTLILIIIVSILGPLAIISLVIALNVCCKHLKKEKEKKRERVANETINRLTAISRFPLILE